MRAIFFRIYYLITNEMIYYYIMAAEKRVGRNDCIIIIVLSLYRNRYIYYIILYRVVRATGQPGNARDTRNPVGFEYFLSTVN